VEEKRFQDDAGLAALAKQFRLAAGKRRAEAARELGVARPTVVQAEENPELSLSKLRMRIIERYSNYKVIGPVYLLEEKES
jgi:DNA-binding XRE family transcriptional regulator